MVGDASCSSQAAGAGAGAGASLASQRRFLKEAGLEGAPSPRDDDDDDYYYRDDLPLSLAPL
jgi:hypothetical protein